MSNVVIQSLLRARYTSVSTGVVHAFPNMPLKPTAGAPYEHVDFLHAKAENPTLDADFQVDPGVLQVTLHYPPNAGAGAALGRAEQLKGAFPRGWSAVSGGVQVRILNSPWSTLLAPSEGWFRVAVSVPFVAEVFS